jgi:NitT/TauT family transport system ATP-binding protein
MAHVEVLHLSVNYVMTRTRQALQAVQDVSFSVRAGEIVAIVGPSGCGKTTLLNAIAGLVPPAHGRISIDGVEVVGPGKDRAMVFQSPALLPWRTVGRNVAYGLELQGRAVSAARTQVQPFIELVGLCGYEESYPHELSGGMQQRVNLARALAVQPKVLLFDEPLAALDAQTRDYMLLELQRIWLQAPTTSIFVTHQIREAIFLADRVVVMATAPGRIKEIIPVTWPRPRTLHLQRTVAFVELEDRIWDMLDRAEGLENHTHKALSGVRNG